MTAATKTSPLERDLSLVLPDRSPRRVGEVTVSASIAGKAASLDAALDQAGQMLRAAKAPALFGLAQLSIEAIRAAVALAETMRGRLLPWPAGDAMMANLSVTQTATLGHLFASDAVVWVGCDAASGPIAAAIARRVKSQHTLPATIEAVLAARGGAGKVLPAGKRLTVVLAHNANARVVSQWHKFAADVQRNVRVAVFSLPHPHAENLRGAVEVIGWQTGVNVTGGGVDFADGPRKCADAATLLGRGGVDVVIDTTDGRCESVKSVNAANVIAIGTQPNPTAAVSFVVPGLTPGLAARVMRCDGVVLWLCDDPSAAPLDPAVDLLERLTQRAGGPG